MSASRRDFLKISGLAGAGLVVRLPFLTAAVPASASAEPFAPNQWLRVGTDGRVTLVVARTEMGQGVRTALSMILADELEADWAAVSVEQASTGPLYTDMNTGGSDSVESSWMPLRKAAASARTMLVAAAAQQWNVGVESCRAERGSVVHGPTGRRLSYASLAAAAAGLPVPKDPALKDPKDFRIVGNPVRRVDGPAIVTGKAQVRSRYPRARDAVRGRREMPRRGREALALRRREGQIGARRRPGRRGLDRRGRRGEEHVVRAVGPRRPRRRLGRGRGTRA